MSSIVDHLHDLEDEHGDLETYFKNKHMENQTLKINIPDGFIIDTFDQEAGEIKFKPKPKTITERIQTVDDVLAEWDMTRAEFDEMYKKLSDDEKAYKLIKMLVHVLNEDWQPNWENHNQSKYYPWFQMGGSSGFRFDDFGYWDSHSFVGSRLCFKTRELAKYAGTQFTDLYKEFMIIK